MKKHKSLLLMLFTMLVFAALETAALGQAANDKLASVTGGASVRWDFGVANSGVTLIISAPDGRVFRKESKTSSSADFALIDKQGERLPDGTYSYELRLAAAGAKDALKSRASDDASEDERTSRKRSSGSGLVQSGSFAIVNGSAIVEGAVEGGKRIATTQPPRSTAITSGNIVRTLRNHRTLALPDDVIADDLIVQGSACVGLDCVNGEVFGFDTIRLKENNDRIQFDDTSTGAGFPTNNWQIRANSSASGGESFLGIVDQGATGNSETGTIVFQVTAAAPANSIKVASNGKVGFRTATPVLDLHVNTTDTPAMRFEQNNSGGFTAQTWDVGANEANFFVRDVTGGSRLPFRVRPGAPTSSIDISASGSVGIGTASPSTSLHLSSAAAAFSSLGQFLVSDSANSNRQLRFGYDSALEAGWIQASKVGTTFEPLLLNPNGANVGIGTTAPTDTLSVNGTASKPGGGSWAVFSDERLKSINGNFNTGLKALMQLQPIRYQYKRDNVLGLKSGTENVGFGAQTLQKVIPEAVTQNSAGYLMVNNDPILWTMLNAIKEQQKEIAELKGQVQKLRAASHKRRR